MIALPPLFGAVNPTEICAAPGVTDGWTGADGIVLGTVAADDADAAPGPFAFVAVTVHVYDRPFVSAPTTIGEAAPLAEPAVPPFDDVQFAAYPVITLPPLLGAVNPTEICALPGVTDGCAGAEGIVLGTAAADAVDGAPSPVAFVATTVHVYVLPFVRPPTTSGEAAPFPEPAAPPSDEVHATLNPVIGLPPSKGAVKATLICALPGCAVGWAGGSGTRFGITVAEAGEAALEPCEFVAVSVHVYVLPLVRPRTMIGEAGPLPDPAAPPFDDAHAAPYPVIGLPPSNGATKITLTWPLPAPTVGAAGVDGIVLGITAADAGDGDPAPFAFVAVTVHV